MTLSWVGFEGSVEYIINRRHGCPSTVEVVVVNGVLDTLIVDFSQWQGRQASPDPCVLCDSDPVGAKVKVNAGPDDQL